MIDGRFLVPLEDSLSLFNMLLPLAMAGHRCSLKRRENSFICHDCILGYGGFNPRLNKMNPIFSKLWIQGSMGLTKMSQTYGSHENRGRLTSWILFRETKLSTRVANVREQREVAGIWEIIFLHRGKPGGDKCIQTEYEKQHLRGWRYTCKHRMAYCHPMRSFWGPANVTFWRIECDCWRWWSLPQNPYRKHQNLTSFGGFGRWFGYHFRRRWRVFLPPASCPWRTAWLRIALSTFHRTKGSWLKLPPGRITKPSCLMIEWAWI